MSSSATCGDAARRPPVPVGGAASWPLLIALADHPTHHLKLWPGGLHLAFGRQLGGHDVDRLDRLLAQLGRVV